MKPGELKRLTPLLRKGGLKPGGPLKRTPIRQRKSAKVRAFEDELDRMRPLVAQRSKGRCEGRVKDVCIVRAVHVHHRWPRGRGGSNRLVNLLHLCQCCHDWAHANPEMAKKAGLLALRRA